MGGRCLILPELPSHKRPAVSPPRDDPPPAPALRLASPLQLPPEDPTGGPWDPQRFTKDDSTSSNATHSVVEITEDDTCWACDGNERLEPAYLISTDDHLRFCYFLSQELLPFYSIDDADNAVILCFKCHREFNSSPPAFVIMPMSLRFLIHFEEADYQRRRNTGGPRTVPTGEQYAPRMYRVLHLVDYSVTYGKALRRQMPWGGSPTAMVIKAAAGVMFPTPQIPAGLRALFTKLIELYSRPPPPKRVEIPKPLLPADERESGLGGRGRRGRPRGSRGRRGIRRGGNIPGRGTMRGELTDGNGGGLGEGAFTGVGLTYGIGVMGGINRWAQGPEQTAEDAVHAYQAQPSYGIHPYYRD